MMTGHKSNRLEEIGEAMSRAAGTAQAAGISFERLGAYIATVSETTRQEAGSIGTALNSMMTRMTQIKQKGFSEEDGTKVNDVAKALASVGIELLDVNGEWRRMEDIYAEISAMWDTLTEKEQNYLATTMAMTRQQNTFRIIMQRYDRIEELYETAMNSEGTAEQKMSIWQESYAASQQNLLAEWEQFVSHMDVTPLLIDLNDKLAYTLGLVNEILNPTSKMTPYEKSVQAIKELAEYNK
jgi:TP901 family phage tail tape measure protein